MDPIEQLLRAIEDRQKRIEDRLQRIDQILEQIRRTGNLTTQQAAQLFTGAGGGL